MVIKDYVSEDVKLFMMYMDDGKNEVYVNQVVRIDRYEAEEIEGMYEEMWEKCVELLRDRESGGNKWKEGWLIATEGLKSDKDLEVWLNG